MSEICHGGTVAGPCDAPDFAARRPVNRSGLSTLSMRITTHGASFARMLHALPREKAVDRLTGVETLPLAMLSARTTADPTIALIDSFAATLDVLSFYSERIANEGYIRTARERLSAVELLRGVDYELKPGVAASAHLAFTVESLDDPFRVVDIPERTAVMSVPKAPGDAPQTFETIEAISARAEWNAIPARTERPQNLAIYWNAANDADAKNGAIYLLDLDNSFDLSDADPADVKEIRNAAEAADFLPLAKGIDLAAVLADLAADNALNAEIEVVIRALRIDHAQIRGVGLAIPAGARVLAVGVRYGADGAVEKVRTRPFRIDGVTEDRAYGLTRLQLGAIDAAPAPLRPLRLRLKQPVLRIGAPVLAPIAFNTGSVAATIGRATWSGDALSAFVRTQNWSRTHLMLLFRQVEDITPPEVGAPTPGLYLLRQGVAAFGAGAPAHATLAKPDQSRGPDPYATNWDTQGPGAGPMTVWTNSQGVALDDAHLYLERETPEALPDGWALLELTNGTTKAFRVARVATSSRVDFGLSGKTTGLSLRAPDGSLLDVFENNGVVKAAFAPFTFRKTTIRLASESLPFGGLPIIEDVGEDERELSLDGLYLDVETWRSVAVQGERADAPGIISDETLTLADVVHIGGFTRLTFTSGLTYNYKRPSVRVNANVALATHGETRSEPLGSGDGTRANQAFKLSKPPLTFIAAETDSGAASTLDIRVNGVLWTLVPSLLDAGPDDEVYALRIDDDGVTRVVFGDGAHGRRLPTGSQNVVATYRSGMGVEGNVASDVLSLLKTRPLGVRAATNPSAAAGAAAAETLDEARRRGPQSLRTLGRIVSLTDYEDDARAFAGIGKARAAALWLRRRRVVHVTVAPSVAGVFVAGDSTLDKLIRSMESRRDPREALVVAPHQPLYFRVGAKVTHDPRYLARDVEAAIRAALLARFGFETMTLAESVSAAGVISTIQSVAGVRLVDLDAFELYDVDAVNVAPTLAALLESKPARLNDTETDVEAAQLLTIFESAITLTLEAANA
jgi:hypothetical protein